MTELTTIKQLFLYSHSLQQVFPVPPGDYCMKIIDDFPVKNDEYIANEILQVDAAYSGI